MSDAQNQEENYFDLIKCPDCGSTDWLCWDERTLHCYDTRGYFCGYKVVGYLRCKSCNTGFTHTSIEPDDQCDCDED